MRESSLIPTNLLNWPRVAPLLPELKLILLALWSSPNLGMAGAGLVPLRPFASSLGLSPEALASGLEHIEDLGLIVTDKTTGEVFIRDWFRFHKFSTGRAFGMLISQVEKVESVELKTLIRSCLPSAPTITAAPARQRQQADKVDEQTGVIVRTPEDRSQLARLIQKHGAETVAREASKILQAGQRPFVSSTASQLRGGRDRQLVFSTYDPTKPGGGCPTVQKI